MNATGKAAKRAARRAFSLVEVLAAMTILAIIVLLLGRMFNDSSRLWRNGTRQMELNSSARALMDFMTRDLASAVFDPPGPDADYALAVADGTAALGTTPSLLFFLAASGLPGATSGTGQVEEVSYELKKRTGSTARYQLVRSSRAGSTDLAFNKPGTTWYAPSADGTKLREEKNQYVMIDNVCGFRVFFVPASGSAKTTANTYDTALKYLDVYFELLDSDTAKKVDELGGTGADAKRLIEQNARRYYTRIEFRNQNGYAVAGR